MCKYVDALNFVYTESSAPPPTKRTPKININDPQHKISKMLHPPATNSFIYTPLCFREVTKDTRENTVTNEWQEQREKKTKPK